MGNHTFPRGTRASVTIDAETPDVPLSLLRGREFSLVFQEVAEAARIELGHRLAAAGFDGCVVTLEDEDWYSG